MKLSKFKSIAHEAIRSSIRTPKEYLIDPFYHYTPEYDIEINLLTGKFAPDLEGDDIEKYYKEIYLWLHNVVLKEGIPIDIIDKAIIKISSKGKLCLIEAQGRRFESSYSY